MDLVRKIDVTLPFILSHISSFDIYRHYLGSEVSMDHAFRNPLRNDRDPSMRLRVDSRGCLMHIDFGDSFYRGGCVDIVSQAFGVDYNQALYKIARDFGLLDRGSIEYKRIVSGYCQPIIDPKRHSLLQVSIRQWEKRDATYWGEYGISIETIKSDEEETYPVKEVWLNRRKLHISPGEIVYAYRWKDGYKIYFPLRKKKDKWLSNIPCSTVEGISCLNGSPITVVAKSRKDRLVLKQIVHECISSQNESTSFLTDTFKERTKNKQLYISFDSDEPGKKASRKITIDMGIGKHVNVPDKLYIEEGITDWSDWVKARNGDLTEIREFLMSKGIY